MAIEAAREPSAQSTADVHCLHCGLPVPPGLIEGGAEAQFCCQGCRAVYGVLRGFGLDSAYYRFAADGTLRQPARVTGQRYESFDDPAWLDRYARRAADGTMAVMLYLEGVHCTACVWLVETLPRLRPGLIRSRLDLGRSMAEVVWDPRLVKLSVVARLLDSVGYPVHPFRGVDLDRMRRREDRALILRIGVAGAMAGNVMLMAIALYAGVFGDMLPEHRRLFRWASLLLTTPAVLYCGSVFFSGALGALRARSLHMDLPISIGIVAGYLSGAFNTVADRGEIYFDSLNVLIFLLLVGRLLQRRQQRKAADATELLYSLTPATARVVDGAGEVRELPAEAVLSGARVEVRSGEAIPVDGTIVEGRSTIDASMLTGESTPVEAVVGDAVDAGTTNLSGRLLIDVSAAGEQTRVGRLMQQIAEHARRRAPIVMLANRVAGRFVFGTLALAAMTAALWLYLDPSLAVDNAISLLIVTCPCALGLATPLAVSVAIGRAARRGLLIKGGDALERLARPGEAMLDKTGTLTAGRMALLEWEGDAGVARSAAALERQSAHPVARALVAAHGEGVELEAVKVCEEPGAGISGEVDGARLQVGSPAFIRASLGVLPSWVEPCIVAWSERCISPVAIAKDGELVALAGFGDPLRDDAAETVRALEARGFRVSVLSGDDAAVVKVVARQLGVSSARGGVSAEQKLELVEAATARGPVLMVGDGVNDAAALTAATAGVAVSGGAEASLAVADVYLRQPGLAGLLEVIDGARATLRVIKRNFVFSIAYNVLGASLAVAGVLTPLIAAVLMPASSLTVLISSFRSSNFSAREEA